MDHFNEEAGPEVSPSGQKPKYYGEVLVKVWLMGPDDDIAEGGEAVVSVSDLKIPFDALVVAAEHLVTAVAMKSGAGFERAVELIAEGAMSNKGKLIKRKPHG